jgi:WD40 repeat protein
LLAFKHWIVSAPTNGKIVLYNLAKDGLKRPERIYEQHERTVNRICWDPIDPYLLFSGSQDGHVKMWDLRTQNKNEVMSFEDSVSVRGKQQIANSNI